MQLKATLLTAAALILLMTGTAEGLSNQACQGVSQHSSPITVTPVYTGNPETLEHIRIRLGHQPPGNPGVRPAPGRSRRRDTGEVPSQLLQIRLRGRNHPRNRGLQSPTAAPITGTR